uniref:Uncharacterized protein n=1 Tax=Ditylenchus dipsaci TaxID=166011 RepID=A0A915DJF0_9BILA
MGETHGAKAKPSKSEHRHTQSFISWCHSIRSLSIAFYQCSGAFRLGIYNAVMHYSDLSRANQSQSTILAMVSTFKFHCMLGDFRLQAHKF